LRLSLYPFKGLLKTFKEKGGGFTRENQTVDKYDQSNLVKIQAKEGDENENQTKD
jgi:hypothetical protein